MDSMTQTKRQLTAKENAPIIHEMEKAARSLSLAPQELFAIAHVTPSNYYRWKNGDTSPTNAKISQLRRMIVFLRDRKLALKERMGRWDKE